MIGVGGAGREVIEPGFMNECGFFAGFGGAIWKRAWHCEGSVVEGTVLSIGKFGMAGVVGFPHKCGFSL